jgi:FtsZ-interacting cell division protein ZipA
MKKTLILILVVIVLIIVAILVARRKPRRTCAADLPSTSFQGVKRDDSDKPVAKVNMVLSTESKLLSYSIVLKNLKHEVKSVHFVSNGKEVYQASGPRNPTAEGGEIVVHGLWREKSKVPITTAHIADLVEGKMTAIVKFEDSNIEPFLVEMKPKV